MEIRILFTLLLLGLTALGVQVNVDLDAPHSLRWDGLVQRLLFQNEKSILEGPFKLVTTGVPASVITGLNPLVELFSVAFEETKMKEILAIGEFLEKKTEGKITPLVLIQTNLLIELATVFPDLSKSFDLPKVTVDYIKNGKIMKTKDIVFGYVGEEEGEMLKIILETSHGVKGINYLIEESMKAMQVIPVENSKTTFNESRCVDEGNKIICTKNQANLYTGLWLRSVLWQVPVGPAPERGWPVVLHFQGSFCAPHLISWSGEKWMPFGAFEQTKGIKLLLDAGYAVITPESHLNGFTFWDTNIPPFSLVWDIAPDHLFMKAILKEIANPDGMFGYLDYKRKFATGISSGGYMTSRMAVSYEGEFLSLAVTAGSYATCAGPLCVVPKLPKNHPPTLFVHGSLDPIVPQYTMEMYADQLTEQGTEIKKFIDPFGFHEWVDGSSVEVLDWFNKFNTK